MPVIYIINGILISMFGFDHNPSHIHVRYGEYEFTISLDDRIVKGSAPMKVINEVNNFIDSHLDELKALWEVAKNGGEIKKIKR
ncbi:MAG: DUF4160 domain-containing protein [Paramuribaculum sp.]|nr:DUF4160 domain-containing protein [Paramuribaculum sp.]